MVGKSKSHGVSHARSCPVVICPVLSTCAANRRLSSLEVPRRAGLPRSAVPARAASGRPIRGRLPLAPAQLPGARCWPHAGRRPRQTAPFLRAPARVGLAVIVSSSTCSPQLARPWAWLPGLAPRCLVDSMTRCLVVVRRPRMLPGELPARPLPPQKKKK